MDVNESTAIAIVGMGCALPSARDLTAFWKLVCYGTGAASGKSVDAPSSTPQAVIETALADREAAREWQRQKLAKVRRQFAGARMAALQAPASRASLDKMRLVLALAGDERVVLDESRIAGHAAASDCAMSRHPASLAALRAVMYALRDGHCDIGIVAAAQLDAGETQARAQASAALVLKRLDDAQRDGDRIYAVLRGAEGATDELRGAYERLGIDPQRIALIECDAADAVSAATAAAEIEQLHATFGREGYPSVLLGSIKSLIGEVGAVGALAGVIKTALALYHRTLPPTLQRHRQGPPPQLENSRLYVRAKLSPWIAPLDKVRLAAVNERVGGMPDGHVILEEPPAGERSVPQLLTAWSCELIVLSAPTLERLSETLVRLRTAIALLEEHELGDLAHTLAQRYSHTDRFRLATVTHSTADLATKMACAAARLASDHLHQWTDVTGIFYGCAPYKGRMAFLFPGVGFPGLSGAYADRIGELALHFPELRWWLDRAESSCKDDGVPYPLRFQLYPPDDFDPATLAKVEEELKWSQRAAIGTQIANLATCQLMRSLGVRADAMAGFSLGEWSALVASGFVASQGIEQWQQAYASEQAVGGSSPVAGHRGTWAMATASAETVEAILRPLGDAIAVTLDVSSTQVFIGGDCDAVEQALPLLKKAGIWAMPLPSDGPMAAFSAFHTKHAAVFVDGMRKSLEALPLHALDCTVYSSVNARPFPREPEQIVPLLVENATKAVRLRETVSVMYRDGYRIFLQLGGGGKLLPTLEKILGLEPHVAMSIDVEYLSGLAQFQLMLARLMALGVSVDPLSLYGNRACRTLELDLPMQSKVRKLPLAAARPPHAAVPAPTPAISKLAAKQETTPAREPGAAAPAWPLLGKIHQWVEGERLESHLQLDLAVHRFLVEHSLLKVPDGLKPAHELMPTLPFTVGIEIISEAAQTLLPRLRVVACRDVEQAKFIALESAATLEIWIRARRSAAFEVSVEVGISGDAKPALQGTVVLAEQPLAAPAPLQLRYDRASPHDAHWYYGKGPFFHGPLWRVIRALHEISPTTIRGEVACIDTRDLFYTPEAGRTIHDPVLLDGVAQLLGFGKWMEKENFFVPTGVKLISFHHETQPPGTHAHAHIRFRELDARRLEGDFDVLDGEGRTIVHVEGWREWWLIWPKLFLQTNHLARVAQLASAWSDAPEPIAACRVNESALLDAQMDLAARMYITCDEWQEYAQQRRIDWLLGRIAAKDAVRSWYRSERNRELHPLEVSIVGASRGALIVSQPHGESLRLSVAHTADEAVAVVAEQAVGVDIVDIKPRAQSFIDLVFEPEEMSALPQTQGLKWLHRAWAAKEALAKMLGETDRTLKHFTIRRLDTDSGAIQIASAFDAKVWVVHTREDESRALAIVWQQVRQSDAADADRVEHQAQVDANPIEMDSPRGRWSAWLKRAHAAVLSAHRPESRWSFVTRPFANRKAEQDLRNWTAMLQAQALAAAPVQTHEPRHCVLRVSQLTKSYGLVPALTGVSFNLGAGEIVGLLGQNGSGKTTLLNALMGRTRPDTGCIVAFDGAGASAGKIGWVPQQLAVYPFMSARENLRTFGRYQGIAADALEEEVERALKWADLESRADDPVSAYSFGMTRRLNICIGVLNRPDIVLMDEPTLGVDLQSRERMHQMVQELRARGAAVLYTSHYIEEVERLCDRILIIEGGKIACEGTAAELIQKSVGSGHEVEIHSAALSAETALKLQARGLQLEGQRILARIDDIGRQLPALLDELRSDNVPISNLVIRQPTLASAFLKLTGRSLPP